MATAKKEFRNYDKLDVNAAVREHYRKMRQNQTYDYVQKNAGKIPHI